MKRHNKIWGLSLCALCCGIALTAASCNHSDENDGKDENDIVENLNDYFPNAKEIASNVVIVKAKNFTKNELMLITSLQGILAQEKSSIYIDYGNKSDSSWIDAIKAKASLKELTKLEDIINEFKGKLNKKYVLFTTPELSGNSFDASLNNAATISGIDKFIMVSSDLEDKIVDLGFSLGKDATKLSTKEVFDLYKDKANKNLVVNQNPNYTELRDFGIQNKAIHFYSDLELNQELINEILSWVNDNGVIYGGGSNFINLGKLAAKNNLEVLNSTHCANLSILAGVKADSLKQAYNRRELKPDSSKHYLAILVNGGEDSSVTLNNMLGNEDYFNTKHDYPITYQVNSSLACLAPISLEKVYANSENNEFIAAPGGAAYASISSYGEDKLGMYADISSKTMEKADLNYISFKENEINMDGIAKFANKSNINGGIWQLGANDISGLGSVHWSNDKPFVSARETLRSGTNDDKYYAYVERIAQRINAYKKDPTKIEGYTVLVADHNTIGNYDNINTLVESLDSSVELVSVGELLDMVSKNVEHKDVDTLSDKVPSDFDGELAEISTNQITMDMYENAKLSDKKEFKFDAKENIKYWTLGNAGGLKDEVFDTNREIVLNGVDYGVNDMMPNSWIYKKYKVEGNEFIHINLKSDKQGQANFRLHVVSLENGRLVSDYLSTISMDNEQYEGGYYTVTNETSGIYSFDLSAYAGKEILISIDHDDSGESENCNLYISSITLSTYDNYYDIPSKYTYWNTPKEIYSDWHKEGRVMLHNEGTCLEKFDSNNSAIYNKMMVKDGVKFFVISFRKFIRPVGEQDKDPHLVVYINNKLTRALRAEQDYVTAKGDLYDTYYYFIGNYQGQAIDIKIETTSGQHAAINRIQSIYDVPLFGAFMASHVTNQKVSTDSSWTDEELYTKWGNVGYTSYSNNEFVLSTSNTNAEISSLIYNKLNIKNNKLSLKFDSLSGDSSIMIYAISHDMVFTILESEDGLKEVNLGLNESTTKVYDLSQFNDKEITLVIGTKSGAFTRISDVKLV